MGTKLQQISELSTLLRDKNAVCQKNHSHFESFHIDQHLRKLNMEKQKGQSTQVFTHFSSMRTKYLSVVSSAISWDNRWLKEPVLPFA